jgi:antitoxin (DNA-binding transcriptional repressor) of toxin-antitoxin stability system
MQTTTERDPDAPLVVGTFEAKTHLSRLLRQARAGKRIVITQRGKPVAEMGPINAGIQQKLSHWGDMEGKIWMADDFCDELKELTEFFT